MPPCGWRRSRRWPSSARRRRWPRSSAPSKTTIGPYAVPPNSEVVIWIYLVHHDPRWYPNPSEFRPERFEPDAEAARPKYAYLPFGAGQRACIGQMFAMLEAQLILATLWPRLRFEFAGRRRPKLQPGLTLAPRGFFWFQLEEDDEPS